MCLLWLNFLCEDRGLAPADRLWGWKSILMDDAEVSLGLVLHFTWRMALETEEYLEKNANQSGVYRQVQQMTSGCDYARELVQPVGQWHILQRARSNNQVE